MPIPFEPSRNLGILFGDRSPNRILGAGPIVPSGRRRDIAFMIQALAKFRVGPTNVLAERVPAGGLVF